MRRLLLAFLALLGPCTLPASTAPAWQDVAPGIEYQRVVRGALDAHVVRVDLARAGLEVVATTEAGRGLTVSDFARRHGATVAIYGDYFDVDLQPIGLAMGAGRVWGTASGSIRRQEVIGVGGRRVAIFPRAEPLKEPEPWMTGAVSGWPAIVERCAPVARLPGSAHFTQAPHPRTAVGLSADGRRLYLVVADGRRDGVPGLTLPELARLMGELGACTAVNLDGGGSSAMWVVDRIVNQPSDRLERPVANHLAILVASSGSMPGLTTDPIRGPR